MYKHLCIFCAYLLITSFVAFAQPNRGQKIYQQFISETKGMKEDTSKVLRYIKFANLLNQHEMTDTALAIIKRAKALSGKLNYQHGIVLSIFEEGANAEINKNYPLAIQYYRAAARIAELHKLYNDIYQTYNSCLNIYYYQADYPNAMDLAQKGLSLAQQLNNKEDQAHYNNQIGFVYQKQENVDKCINYYTQYLNLANEMHNNMMVADACNGIADGYLLKKDYKTSLIYFFKALGIYNGLKEEKSQKLYKLMGITRHERVAYTLFRISTTYKQAGDDKKALYYSLPIFDIYNKREKIGLGTFNAYDLAGYYINMGDIYRLLKDYKKAAVFLNQGLLISRSILHREDMRDAYEALSKNFAAQGQYGKAYHYHLLFTGLKDSIINEKVNRAINNLEVERGNKEISLLNQQQKTKAAEVARENLTRNFFIGVVMLVAVIAFLLLYIHNGSKVQKLKAEKQLALQNERQRISSDMHDDIGSGLSTMLIYINMLKMELRDNEDIKNVDRIAILGTGIVEQMKEIVWSLSPGNDRLDSLLLFIRQYVVMLFEPLAYNVNVVFPISIPDVELKSEVRRNIFLCVKESINNIIKHANATSVELNVQIIKPVLIILIKDNGKGLPIAEENISGNGLKNISRRMNMINGKSDIFNEGGAVVRLELNLLWYSNG